MNSHSRSVSAKYIRSRSEPDNKEDIVKTRIMLVLLTTLALSACKSGPLHKDGPDDIITSQVGDLTLKHRRAIEVPASLKPINQPYTSLYAASIMTRPDYGGQVVGYLTNAKPFYVIGQPNNRWLAISEEKEGNLVGYVPFNAGVPSTHYQATLRQDRPRRVKAKNDCVTVGEDSKACKDASETWIIE